MKSADDFLTEKKTYITEYIISSNEMFKEVWKNNLKSESKVTEVDRGNDWIFFLFVRILWNSQDLQFSTFVTNLLTLTQTCEF